MAISNIQETLLLYTKQKSLLNDKLSTTLMNLLNCSKQVANSQQMYNENINDIYFEYYEEDPDNYEILMERAEQDHELELANLNSWEEKLELDKNNIEAQLNEVNTFESSWTKLLQNNIKSDFSYGGAQGQ